VIASDGGALPELVADGETGRVVPAREPAALADAISALLAAPERCHEMGGAAHRRVLERFTWNNTALHTEALYHDVLAAKGPRR
jgi:glycosyltransferase involved in cell wall biosynthesis